jgi:hypothetical protein
MKRLVLLGEGHGELSALPVLVKKVLAEKDLKQLLYVDKDVIRIKPCDLVKWDKLKQCEDPREWLRALTIASRRRDVGGVLAVYDGDAKTFPAGSSSTFCARQAARFMSSSAVAAGAGVTYSLSVVFACVEFETWLIAGLESFRGKRLSDGRLILPENVTFPAGDVESHGKGWLERYCINYRPARDQSALTNLVSLESIRAKKLRSFQRLEHALEQLLVAVASGSHVSAPDR